MVSLALVQLFAASIAVEGVVLADRDGDGAVSAADRPVSGALVFWETEVVATTDGDGRFRLDAPGPGIVWVRTPEGFAPGPVWREVTGGQPPLTLLLRPMAASGPLRFVHASDTHVGTNSEEATRRAVRQATGADPPPWFLVVTGDITAGTQPVEFDALAGALRDIAVPFVPVVGNHDWHDDGISYRRRLGPPMHSFDAGGVHFIALNFMASADAQLGFVDRDLAARPAAGPLVVFTHATPANPMAAALARRGVDYLFTGHSHDNRVMQRGALLEVNTQTAVMGGIDYTPAGYRLVELRGGRFSLEHHTYVREPLVEVSYPRPGDCVPPGRIAVIAAVEIGAAPDAVELSLDGAPPVRLAAAGGWAFAGEVTLARPRWYSLEVRARRGEQTLRAASRFCVIVAGEAGEATAALPDWPMLQGSAEHRGSVVAELSPPLRPIWARAIGGHARAGGPVLAGGRLFVPVVDLSDSRGGGLVAFDARRGDRLWQRRGIGSVAATPAVAGHTVVFTTTDGWLHAHRVDDGRRLWMVDLAAGEEEKLSALYAAPVIAGGRVYAGNQRRFAAVDLRSGAVVAGTQVRSMWTHLYAAPAVARGQVIVPLGRGPSSLLSLDAEDLSERWTRSYRASTRIHSSPVVDGDIVYAGNAEDFLSAIDLDSGEPEWTEQLYGGWSRWSLGTPALAHGLLLVPTPRRYLYAVEAASGSVAWRKDTGWSRIHPVAYHREARGFLASPVVTDRIVWAGGIDGVLRALDVRGGAERWQTDLGSPVVGGLVPSGDLLFVVTYDGTVRALSAAPAEAPPDPLAPAWLSGWRWPIALLIGLAAAVIQRRWRRSRRR